MELRGSLGIEATTALERELESWQARLLRLKLYNHTVVTPAETELETLTGRSADPLIARVAAKLVAQTAGAQMRKPSLPALPCANCMPLVPTSRWNRTMRITSVTIRNYRIHRELKVDLDRSLTLIGGPNESGKSTLVEAAHRALFLKSRITGEVQKSMVSRIHAGHPEVEVCFDAGAESYRILKRFSGASGTSLLSALSGETWQGDEAETRLAELLGVDAASGGRGGGDRAAQQWAHLWVWQGRAGDNPSEHATTQKDSLLARLQASGGAAAMQSEFDAVVAGNIARQHETLFNKNGTSEEGLGPRSGHSGGRRRADSACRRAGDAGKTPTGGHRFPGGRQDHPDQPAGVGKTPDGTGRGRRQDGRRCRAAT